MVISTWAIDDGYGDIKGFNGRDSLLLPSFCTNWRPKQRADFSNTKVDPFSHITVEHNGLKYLIGRGALEQDTKLTWIGGENKHTDRSFPILLGGALSLLARGEREIVIDPLVMGLPVKASENEARVALLRELTLGVHETVVTLADGTVSACKVDIKDLVCKKQPFGSFCNVILNERGEIANRELASQFNVIIDIGSRTLNLYTLDALQPIYDLCDTTNDGVFSAYKLVKTFIEGRLGQQVPEGRLPYIIERGSIKGFQLHEVIRESYATLANIIHSKVETLLVDSWVMVDNVFITGGGATLLRPWLENAFKGKPTVFLDRYSTVKGFQKYGVRLALKEGKPLSALHWEGENLGEM